MTGVYIYIYVGVSQNGGTSKSSVSREEVRVTIGVITGVASFFLEFSIDRTYRCGDDHYPACADRIQSGVAAQKRPQPSGF